MKDNKKNTVYQPLIRRPKIAGLSHGLFGLLVGCLMIVLLMFGITWIGVVASIIVGMLLYRVLIKAEEKDEFFLMLWLGKIISANNHLRPRPRIDHDRKKKTKSIPTLH
ncbi:hypothetical protein [Rhodohalobacter sp. 614A]|uniref:hypothetical protein n=1 Tax=Rhodohalobacter sp. 614A TaxID=2908649 RepID=UPI001F3CEA50|nr:hypothetical protein [Rhodohalobacter sp. 614A]